MYFAFMEPWEFAAPALLYAETHFRFSGWTPSFLFRRVPEVLFDAPARIAPERDLPILLIINDLVKYPATVSEVVIALSGGERTRVVLHTTDIEQYRRPTPLPHQRIYLFSIQRDTLPDTVFYLNAKAVISQGETTSIILNDNLVTTRKSALCVHPATDSFPGASYCWYGDLHAHSCFSESHVEFGPPVSVIDAMAFAYGLDFAAVTDHSYDLACSTDNYLISDKDVSRWSLLRKEFANSDFRTLLLMGEEVSALNSRGKAVHLGVLGCEEYIPGVRDGARRNALKNNTLSIGDALDIAARNQAVAFAAHPGARPGLLQRLFLGRGRWRFSDFSSDIEHIQAANGDFSREWYRTRALWIKLLLAGRRLALVAGNDAHGDYNRYRNLGVPFFAVSEQFDRHFGRCRTGVYSDRSCDSSPRALLERLKNGATFVTDGPFIGLCNDRNPLSSLAGATISSQAAHEAELYCAGGLEYGMPVLARVFKGNYATQRETMIAIHSLDGKQRAHWLSFGRIDAANGYIRAEVECQDSQGNRSFAATSPCYIEN